MKTSRRILITSVVICVLFICSVSSTVQAQASPVVHSMIEQQISSFVSKMLNDSTLSGWAWSLLMALVSLSLIKEYALFAAKGLDIESHLNAVFWAFMSMALMFKYQAFCNAFWNIGISLGNQLQTIATGNTDNFFFAQYLSKEFAALDWGNVGITSGFYYVALYVLWLIISGLLQVCAWLAGIWGEFGNALCQIVGIMFVPFLSFGATRRMFDGWIKLFAGFVVTNVILKAVIIISVLMVIASIRSMGIDQSYDFMSLPTPAAIDQHKEEMYKISDALGIQACAVFFFFASFGFAGVLTMQMGSVSGGIEKTMQAVIKKAAAALL